MKSVYGFFVVMGVVAFSGCVSAFKELDTSNLSLVNENHALVKKNDVTYILDSYIVLFEQPYYIMVGRDDNKIIMLDEAVKVAIEYIKPRGCTSPLLRRPDLDQYNGDKTQWLIGIEC